MGRHLARRSVAQSHHKVSSAHRPTRNDTGKRPWDDALQKHVDQTDEQPWQALVLDRAVLIATEAGFVNRVRRNETPVRLERGRHMMAEARLKGAGMFTERGEHVRYHALPNIGATTTRISAAARDRSR